MAGNFGNTSVPVDDEDDDDSEDVDYVPSEHDSSASDADVLEDSSDEEEDEGTRKRKADSPDPSSHKKTAADSAAEEAQRSDSIWEQFKAAVKEHREMKDSSPVKKQSPEQVPEVKKEETKQPSPSENVQKETSSKIIASKTGPNVSLTPSSSVSTHAKTTATALSSFGKQPLKPGISPASTSRLGSILAQIGQPKKSKNMLEQTREHWEDFKQAEGISDELALHNRGSKGYLDRQDFLARVDSRQDEQLRQMRLQLMNKRRTT